MCITLLLSRCTVVWFGVALLNSQVACEQQRRRQQQL